MNELALFAGAGGGILGGKLLGWRTVCAVEIDAYARSVLLARQRDGCLEPFPIWDDVTTFDGHPWAGRVDVVSGGFPCQDISSAGKRRGISGERSGLWAEFARIVGEVQPSFVFVENSPMLLARGAGVVLGDLAALGYDARWGVVSAENAGAPHERERFWLVAHRQGNGSAGNNGTLAGAEEEVPARKNQVRPRAQFGGGGWWASEQGLGRVADGMARDMDRLRVIGNGQVPAVVRLAWRLLASDEAALKASEKASCG